MPEPGIVPPFNSTAAIARGDRFVAYRAITPGPHQARHRLFVEVTRVAKDRTWADIRVCNCYVMWTKRQRLPLPDCEPFDWTQDDLDWQAEAWDR